MTYSVSEINTFLKTLGVPVFYGKAFFKKTKSSKYIVFHDIGSTNVQEASDSTVWKANTFQVNVITKKYEETLLNALRALLTEKKIIFTEPSESPDIEDRLILRIFQFELDRFQ